MSGLFRWVVILVLGTLPAEGARAAIYEFTFGGEITLVDGDVPDLWNDVHVGSMFEVVYTFDSQAADGSPANPHVGGYPILTFQLAINGAVSYAEEAGIIVLAPDPPNLQGYRVAALGLDVGGDAGLSLMSTANIYESDDIVLDIDLADFDFFNAMAVGIDNVYAIRGELESFQGRIVPTPGAVAIVLLGLLSKRGRRRTHVTSGPT